MRVQLVVADDGTFSPDVCVRGAIITYLVALDRVSDVTPRKPTLELGLSGSERVETVISHLARHFEVRVVSINNLVKPVALLNDGDRAHLENVVASHAGPSPPSNTYASAIWQSADESVPVFLHCEGLPGLTFTISAQLTLDDIAQYRGGSGPLRFQFAFNPFHCAKFFHIPWTRVVSIARAKKEQAAMRPEAERFIGGKVLPITSKMNFQVRSNVPVLIPTRETEIFVRNEEVEEEARYRVNLEYTEQPRPQEKIPAPPPAPPQWDLEPTVLEASGVRNVGDLDEHSTFEPVPSYLI